MKKRKWVLLNKRVNEVLRVYVDYRVVVARGQLEIALLFKKYTIIYEFE